MWRHLEARVNRPTWSWPWVKLLGIVHSRRLLLECAYSSSIDAFLSIQIELVYPSKPGPLLVLYIELNQKAIILGRQCELDARVVAGLNHAHN